MTASKRLLRVGAVLLLTSGAGALITAGTWHVHAPNLRSPVAACAAALRAQGWSVSATKDKIEARHTFGIRDWRGVLYATDAALGADACSTLRVQSACAGPGCRNGTSITLTEAAGVGWQ